MSNITIAEQTDVKISSVDKSYYVTYRLVSDIPDLFDTVINPLGCENVRQATPVKNIGMDTSHYDHERGIKESTNVDIAGDVQRIWNEFGDNGTPYLMGEVKYSKENYITDFRGNKIMSSYDAYEQGIIKGISLQFNDKPFRSTDTVRSKSGRIHYNRWWLTRISVLVSTTGDMPGQPSSGEISSTLRKFNNNNYMLFNEGDILKTTFRGVELTGELTEFDTDLNLGRIEGKDDQGIFELTLPLDQFTLDQDQSNRCIMCDMKKEREKKRLAEDTATRMAEEEVNKPEALIPPTEDFKPTDDSKPTEEQLKAEQEAQEEADKLEADNKAQEQQRKLEIDTLKSSLENLRSTVETLSNDIKTVAEAKSKEAEELLNLNRSFISKMESRDQPTTRSFKPTNIENSDVRSIFEGYAKAR